MAVGAKKRRRWPKSFRRRIERVRLAVVPVLVASVAAVAAFLVSKYLFGHPTPFFAPVAAWICLGFTKNKNPRRVAELGAGAVLGVLTAEVAMRIVGSGWWQIGLVLVIAALGARFTDKGDLFTLQAGVNAMVVMVMGPAAGNAPVSRVVDAMVGGLVALLFSAALPRDLTARPRRYVRMAQASLAHTLDHVADGLGRGDGEALLGALDDLEQARRAIRAAQDVASSAQAIAGVNPLMRSSRPRLAEIDRQLGLLERATSGVETLIRQGRGVVAEAGPSPRAAGLVVQARSVVNAMRKAVADWKPPLRARALATGLAAGCDPGDLHEEGWREAVLVSVMRTVAIDVLQMTGLSRLQARALLPESGDDEVEDDAPALEEASPQWGGPVSR